MSISEMTHVSYFFMIMAVVFGGVAVAMFFAYDIRRCWQIVRGKQVSVPSVKVSVNRKKEEKTEPLCPNAYESTVLLAAEETEPLETMCLVQDITMMDVK